MRPTDPHCLNANHSPYLEPLALSVKRAKSKTGALTAALDSLQAETRCKRSKEKISIQRAQTQATPLLQHTRTQQHSPQQQTQKPPHHPPNISPNPSTSTGAAYAVHPPPCQAQWGTLGAWSRTGSPSPRPTRGGEGDPSCISVSESSSEGWRVRRKWPGDVLRCKFTMSSR